VRRTAYPTSDGRAFDSDVHRQLMSDLIRTLKDRFASDPQVYVSGWLMVFPFRGDKRRYVDPDVFVVKDVADRLRDNYLVWEEGRGPNVVIELTSSRTRWRDTERKFRIYRDVLKVPEYFLFDPLDHYLEPRLQGYRLATGEYRPIRRSRGRLWSRELGLWLEPDGPKLRLSDSCGVSPSS
jgi:Uma2 family endonuclease